MTNSMVIKLNSFDSENYIFEGVYINGTLKKPTKENEIQILIKPYSFLELTVSLIRKMTISYTGTTSTPNTAYSISLKNNGTPITDNPAIFPYGTAGLTISETILDNSYSLS